MQIELLTGYANLAFLATLAALALIKYRKSGQGFYGVITLAALLYFAYWWLQVSPAPWLEVPEVLPIMEAGAAILLVVGVLLGGQSASPLSLLFMAAPAAIFLGVSAFMYVDIKNYVQSAGLIPPVVRLCLGLFGAIMVWTRGRISPHYGVQGFMFICASAALDIYAPFTDNKAEWAPLAARLADAFAFFSMILFVESVREQEPASAQPAREAASIRGAVYNASQRIARGISRLDTAASDNEWFSAGLNVIAQSLKEAFGYQHVSLAIWNGADPQVQAVNGFLRNGTRLQEVKNVLSAEVVRKLAENREILVSGGLREDLRLRSCRFDALVWNSAALVPLPARNNCPACVLIVGDRADGQPVQQEDFDALSFMQDAFEIFFAYLFTRSELFRAPNLDPVTLQQNYSSFQKMLSETMNETDKSGGSFALVLFDIDKFHAVNDRLGFERGDQILRDLGAIIRGFAQNGFVARVGADEFGIILAGDTDKIRTDIEKIQEKIRKAWDVICPEMRLSLSVAYTIYPYDFLEQTSVFGKMREALAAGSSSMGQLLRVKCT